jgi:hypothetical protein
MAQLFHRHVCRPSSRVVLRGRYPWKLDERGREEAASQHCHAHLMWGISLAVISELMSQTKEYEKFLSTYGELRRESSRLLRLLALP